MKITDKNSFCIMSSSIWQLIGYALFALKIIVPLVIIILGTIDFLKAITSSKEDGITNAAKSLIIRVIIGIVIFFIPSLINMIFDILKNASPYIEGSAACRTCLLEPLNPTCNAYKEEAKEIRQNQNNELSTENHDSYYGKQTEHCYLVYNDGDTMGTYVWGNNELLKYDHATLQDRYKTEESCLDPSNPKSLLIYSTDIDKPDSNQNSNGSSNNVTPSTPSTDTTNDNSNNNNNTNSNEESSTKVIYVGDSIMSGICQSNNLSNCYTCNQGGLSWLYGDTYGCPGTTTTIVNDVAEMYEGKEYTVFIYLGTYDVSEGGGTEMANKLINLVNNEWKYVKLIVVPLLPVKANYNSNGITENAINNFNNTLFSIINSAQISDKIKFCSLDFTSSSLNEYYTDGFHLNNDGYKLLYDKISKCL